MVIVIEPRGPCACLAASWRMAFLASTSASASVASASAPPEPLMGSNGSTQALIAACPSRKYHRCFESVLAAKYPVTQFQLPPLPRRCGQAEGAIALADPGCNLPPFERTLHYHGGPSLNLCPEAVPATAATSHLRCDSPPDEINARTVLLLGVPSSPTETGTKRRAAIRASWLNDEHVGRDVVVCFLLSWRSPAGEALDGMRLEQREHGDLLFLDAPETPWLIKEFTKYSGHKKRGRGMPTFKQCASACALGPPSLEPPAALPRAFAGVRRRGGEARPWQCNGPCEPPTRPPSPPRPPPWPVPRYAFFQHAAAVHAPVPFVGKIDDDTAPNLRVLVPFLRRLRCMEAQPYAFVGAINWAAYVPRANEFGVRGDRCGFGWNLKAALSNFGSSFGTRGEAGFVEACDMRGAVLPFPYGTGAGYLFSSALLQHVASSAEVSGWVADAAGPGREELQWQKFEDTSTGYWVSRAPRTVRYVDIGPLVHDVACHIEGERKR